MLSPASGSPPDRLSAAPPRHQPPLPGTPHVSEPLTDAAGSVVVLETDRQPCWPSLQPSIELEEEMLHPWVWQKGSGQLQAEAVK